jgi:hypothetical protein
MNIELIRQRLQRVCAQQTAIYILLRATQCDIFIASHRLRHIYTASHRLRHIVTAGGLSV